MTKEWKFEKLGDLCRIRTGKKDVNEGNPEGEFPFFTCAAEHTFSDSYSFDTEALLIAGNGDVGKASYYNGKFEAYQRTYVLSDFVGVLPRFLYLILDGKLKETVSKQKLGNTMPYIKVGMLTEFQLPVPPIPEQQRVIGILDKAFEGIDTAKANTEKNLQNARAIFESHLQSVFSQRGAKWDRVTLQTLLDRDWIVSHLDGNHGSDYPRKDEFISEGVPYISANCMDDERLDMSRAKYLSPSRAALLRKGIAKDNDVLFAHNATVGPVAILHTDEEKVILGTSLTYYRCDPKHILPEYLAHYMRSFAFKSQYLQIMRQSTRNQVPITTQREFFHVIPPLDEQKRIIAVLDGLLVNSQRLVSLYERKIAALEELKKSLLHSAFSGKLS